MKINLPKLGFLALIISSFNSFAQKNNTSGIEQEVLRMTFESKNYEVYELGEIYLLENGVSSPTEIQADLFTSFGGGYDVGIPSNIYGFEDHIEDDAGSKYIGLVFYKPGKSAGERSYVTIPLGNSENPIKLKEKLKYCVEFSISLAESSKFSVNNISALFSKDLLPISTGAIYNSSDRLIKGQGNKVYSGFFGWEKVCNIYTAKGDEKFITIGNFDKNESTKFEAVKKPIDSEAESLSHAYYYIDNVIITQIDNEEQCKCYNTAPERIEDSFSNLIYSKTPEITDKMKPAEKIAAQVAYFRFGKATFTENCKEAMNFVINEMKTNKGSIEIQGHCDAKEIKVGEGDDEYSEMDKKRVAAVAQYFIEQGIAADRIVKTYKSATIPSAEIEEDDEDEVKDAKNRRINFILK
jgi:outer membrane protein OmpA-like peptidoglycan-associated protein